MNKHVVLPPKLKVCLSSFLACPPLIHVPSTASRGTFSITLTVTEKLAPRARLLLYTVHPHGEIVADSARIHSDICFRNKVKTFAFLLRDTAGFDEKWSGNYLIESPALGMELRNGKGVGVSGIMGSCPWNGHMWSGSDKTLRTVGREGCRGSSVNLYKRIQKGHLAVRDLSCRGQWVPTKGEI